jgi:DNA-binding NarL/FixJ family response regulator
MNNKHIAVKVVLVDDHQLIRAGLRALIDEIDGFAVVAEAGTAEEALTLIDAHAPALLVTDISLPGKSGLDLLLQLRERECDIRKVVLSMHATPDFVLSALKAGANGYLVKDAAAVELEIALRAVMLGQSYLSPAISGMVVKQMLAQGESVDVSDRIVTRPPEPIVPVAPTRPARPVAELTPRQLQILTMIAQGQSTKEIAWSLELSVKTIETHRLQLMQRIGIRDVAGLTLYAVKNQLVAA